MRYRGYQRPDIIWVIIGINAVVFVVAFVFGVLSTMSANPVVSLFGLRLAGLAHQPWTIVTNLFTHVDVWHLVFNMMTFYFFGAFLMALIGETRFLIVYFGGGILGNIFYLLLALLGDALSNRFLGSPFSIAIGASGAIFALGGVLAVLRPRERVLLYFVVPMPLWVAVIGGFVVLSFVSNVAWQAHLGGLVFGFIAGYLIKRRGRYSF